MVGRPPTDHLPTTYRPPTDHFFTVQLVHDYLQDLVRIKDLNIKKPHEMTNVTTMSWLWSVNFKTYIVFQNLDIENFGFVGTLHHLGPVEKNIVCCYPDRPVCDNQTTRLYFQRNSHCTCEVFKIKRKLFNLSVPRANLTKPRKLEWIELNCPMKPKGVTTQMKALDEYFLMVVFTLLLNRIHVFCQFYVSFEQRNMTVKG